MTMKEMTFVPRSELNVREVFAQRAERLGYRIVESRAAFPDYLLEHEGDRIFAEAEFRTSNFHRHRHDLARCDLVIVWEHDLPSMPLPVLELKTDVLHTKKRRGRPPGLTSSTTSQWHRRRAFWARRTIARASTDADTPRNTSTDPVARSESD
jgi:hypothetical protein